MVTASAAGAPWLIRLGASDSPCTGPRDYQIVEQKQIVGEFKTGEFPHGLRISPDGREIYVANVEDNRVSVIDIAQSTVVARIPVGKAPVQVGSRSANR